MANPIWQRTTPVVQAMLLGMVLVSNAALAQSSQPTLIQRIRQLIGINRPIAAGGSRSSGGQSVCLISPKTEVNSKGDLTAVAGIPKPTLLTAGALNEVRIYREGKPIWRRVASSTEAIEGPIDWPIEPVKPDEQLTVLLRPRGASGGDFVKIALIGDSAESMKENQILLTDIGRDPRTWVKLLEESGDMDFCRQEHQSTVIHSN